METELKFHLLQNDYTICPDTWGMQEECALFYRMYYILGGEAYYSDKNHGKVRLEKGNFYIFPVMHPYSMWQNKEDPLQVLWFHVEMNLETVPELVKLSIAQDSEMEDLLKALRRLNEKQDLFYEEIEQIFRGFLMLVDRLLPFHKIHSRRMQKISDYIDKHVEEELSIQFLADYAGMERSYFSKQFKNCFSISPQRYVFAKKMNEAARSLIQGLSVKETGAKVGYSDVKAFSRAFKKYMEISPGEYQKRHIEQP